MDKITTIAFFVPPGIHMLDLSGPAQAFLAAAQMQLCYDIRYCSFREEIADSSGLTLAKLTHYREIRLQTGDYLMIPGFSRLLLEKYTCREEWEEFYSWLRELAANEIHI